MKKSEGYLLLDHRDSPGVEPEFVRRSGKQCVTAPAGHMLESATYSCPHCQRAIVLHAERQRERAYCRSCDAIICDECQIVAYSTGAHVPFIKVLEREFEAACRGDAPANRLILGAA